MDEKGDSAHLRDMKACLYNAVGAIALTFTLAACTGGVVPDIAVPGPVPTPTPTQVAPMVVGPPPPPPALIPSQYDDYMDGPTTPGTWTYVDEPGETLGLFGTSTRDAAFIIRCDKESRMIGMARRSTVLGSQPMKIEAETVTRDLTAMSMGDVGLVAIELNPNDDLLDAMAITKGRFAVSTAGQPTLFIPAWVEFSRVIEDCR